MRESQWIEPSSARGVWVHEYNFHMLKNKPCSSGDVSRPKVDSPVDRELSVLLLTTSYPLRSDSVSGVFVQRLACALAEVCCLQVLVPADCQTVGGVDATPSVHAFRYAPRSLQVLAHGAGGIPAAIGANRFNLLLVPFFLLSMLLSCWRQAKGKDVVFANWSVCGIVAGVVGRLRRIPVVVTLRGEDANRLATSLLFRWGVTLCGRLCARIVTVSEAMGARLCEAMPELSHKLVVIPNGVSQVFLDVEPLRAGEERLQLLCVASLIPRKSIATLIRALALTPPSVVLTLIGEGSEQEALVALATELGVRARVEFLPFQHPDKLPAYLAGCDALVLPSRAEGRPNVVLEAFAAGRPVIATAIDGLYELVGTNQRGLLFPVDDSEALARCIHLLANSELRLTLAGSARQYIVDEGLTWRLAAQRYVQLFQKLTQRN